ncbi:MAG: 3-hydroxyacyl-CoA dehydrogenase [Gammaproteobacteria bacterium]|nr:3-hydroxyacyl-CoA dehydrogenase [Gammaproteobacteria bacterium]
MAIELPRFEVKDIVGVVGAGTMGIGIAEVAAAAGHPVLLYDAIEGAASAALEQTSMRMNRRVTRGRISSEEGDAILARVTVVHSLRGLEPCRLVIEAVVEDLAIKQGLFQSLERLCGDSTILASNTSSLSITAIGAALKSPERLLGLHFFNPATVMRLVEVVSGLRTAPEIAASLHGLMSTWGKSPVFARSHPGFIVNRVARPFYAEALNLLQEGAAGIETMDAIYRDCGGFPMGPFELMDLIGLDVNFAVTSTVFESYFGDSRYRPSVLQKEMVDAGRLGRKSGEGFYVYSPERKSPTARQIAPQAAPKSVRVVGDLGPASALLDLARESGLDLRQAEGAGYLVVDGVYLALSDGRSATTRAVEEGQSPLVLYDLALDYRTTPRIALTTVSGQTEALARAAGFFQALGKSVSEVADLPGMLVMRSVCLLANEAALAVAHQLCSAGDLDTAMKLGVNYPLGPLEWGERLDLQRVANVVGNIHAAYGDDRYRLTPLLSRHALAGRKFTQ